jgi:hypothetical protein
VVARRRARAGRSARQRAQSISWPRPFEREHAKFFFGRAAVTEELANIVERQPITIVVAASGAGKSSLVKAGLLPHLEAFVVGRYPFPSRIKRSARSVRRSAMTWALSASGTLSASP